MKVEVPKGCLGCNPEAVRSMLEGMNIDTSLISEVPRPRHNWGDVVCCDECGRAWMIRPADGQEGGDDGQI